MNMHETDNGRGAVYQDLHLGQLSQQEEANRFSADFILDQLFQHYRPESVLDVGCGGGLFMGMMRERGFGVIGLDSSRQAAAIAWRRLQAPALCADMEQAPLRAGSRMGPSGMERLQRIFRTSFPACSSWI